MQDFPLSDLAIVEVHREDFDRLVHHRFVIVFKNYLCAFLLLIFLIVLNYNDLCLFRKSYVRAFKRRTGVPLATPILGQA